MIASLEELDGSPSNTAYEIAIGNYFPRKGSRLYYIYDFGDDWVHEVFSEGIVDRAEPLSRILLAGAGAFPPEDSGGPWGLHDKLLARACPTYS